MLAAPSHAGQSIARQWNEQLLSAIRRNVPNPPAHARNLFQTAISMYNAWAAYHPTSHGYITNEKVSMVPADVEAARREAISYAAYRVLSARFATGAGAAASLAGFDTLFASLGYDTTVAKGAITALQTPAELGKRIGQTVLNWGGADGFSQVAYPQAYNAAVNPHITAAGEFAIPALGTNLQFEQNKPLGFGVPTGTNPNFWQPLALSTAIAQNGLVVPGGVQGFVGVQSLATTPFSLTRTDATKPWLDPMGGPSRLARPGQPSLTDAQYKNGALDVITASSMLNDPSLVDISPKATGNNVLGTDAGNGYPFNPLTGVPYAPSLASVGDFVRVLAEFWADGPNSETPPGHWHVIANEIDDMPALQKRIGGMGALVNDLEWDVKIYFALSGATHDAACASWALKRYYSGARPITMIRYMAQKGQSSDVGGPSYHAEGLPLKPDVVEVITAATAAAGGRHENVLDVGYGLPRPGNLYLGQIVCRSWPGEHPANGVPPAVAANQSLVTWMLAKDWLPFQRKTFNTPAFPGYVSGHSTFSRAAAEVLARITGSPYFPDGFHHHTVTANSLQIDRGPSVAVDLQWASYNDAADQAGQSRRWGGIHVSEDDFDGRMVGAQAGISAWNLAKRYWAGTALTSAITPTLVHGGTVCTVSWNAVRGMHYKLQRSGDLQSWADASTMSPAYSDTMSHVDTAPDPSRRFYRVLATTTP